MKRALQSFNRSTPGQKRWKAQLEHIPKKKDGGRSSQTWKNKPDHKNVIKERNDMQKPSLTVTECCQILRDNNISKSTDVLTAQIQAGLFPSWAIPSVGTKKACPDISRAGFMEWVKAFYHLPEVYTQEEPRE